MSRVEPLTLSSIYNLANLNGLYMLGYAWAFGMGVFSRCLGDGQLSDLALPLHQPSGSLSLQVGYYIIFLES
jgi:hypothetical protein